MRNGPQMAKENTLLKQKKLHLDIAVHLVFPETGG
jgi:hypothetical protein